MTQQSDNMESESNDDTTELPVSSNVRAGWAGNRPQQSPTHDAGPALEAVWESLKHLPGYLKLAAAMARDPQVPPQAKAVLGVGGVYAVSPVDLIPGIIPVIGQIDDLYVMLTALQQAVKMTPARVADRHLDAAGVRREDIDADLRAVRELVRIAVVKSLVFGGKTLGRLSRAATSFASRQLKRSGVQRSEEPL